MLKIIEHLVKLGNTVEIKPLKSGKYVVSINKGSEDEITIESHHWDTLEDTLINNLLHMLY